VMNSRRLVGSPAGPGHVLKGGLAVALGLMQRHHSKNTSSRFIGSCSSCSASKDVINFVAPGARKIAPPP
jgi:hypothetical protein